MVAIRKLYVRWVRARRFINDNYWFKGYFWLAVASAVVIQAISCTVGFDNYLKASALLLEWVSPDSAVNVIAVAAGLIAVLAFFREVPSWSQELVYSTGGEYLPCRPTAGDKEPNLHEWTVPLGRNSFLDRHVLETITMSVTTNSEDVARKVCGEVKLGGQPLFGPSIVLADELWTGNKNEFDGQRFSITRNYFKQFRGDVTVGAKNFSPADNLLVHFTVRARSIHSVGEFVLDGYLRFVAKPIGMLLYCILAVLKFSPDAWAYSVTRKWAHSRNKAGKT